MAAFNLTAQLNLQGPTNIKSIAANIKKQLGTINANVNVNIASSAATNVSKLNSALKQLNTTLATTAVNSSKAAQALRDFSSALGAAGATKAPTSISLVSSSLNKVGSTAASVQKLLGGSTTQMEEFGRQSALAVRRFAAFSIVTGTIYSLNNAIVQGIKTYIDYNKQLVRLQQVTGESANGLKALEKQITGLSTGLGVSSTELTNVALTLAQAGLSARDTEKALKALALSSLAPSFDNMNETVEGSIALMKQFNISASELEVALGAVNAVSARFAVEASDIITAIQRTGGVFATASKGVSEGTDALNEFIAVFTSVRATTRESSETIATGLRTIFTRIQRKGTIDALKEFGVNLTDAEGKFVGAYKAVELLSEGLSRIDPRDIKFSRIVEELGGFRQIGKVIPLIQQFATAQEALKVAQRGAGSLAEDQTVAQKSLANQIAKTREEFLALFREIGASDSFQVMAKSALSLASGIIRVADGMKELLPILTAVMAFRGISALGQFATGFTRGLAPAAAGRRAFGGSVRKYASGGMVPVALMPGEAVVYPDAVKKVGVNNLRKMNYADRKPYAKGGKVGMVPGSGRTDSFYTSLPEGSFVIRKDATKAMGYGNIVDIASGRKKFFAGDTVGKLKRKSKGGTTILKKQLEINKKQGTIIHDSDFVASAGIERVPVELTKKDFQTLKDSVKDPSGKRAYLRGGIKTYDKTIWPGVFEKIARKKAGRGWKLTGKTGEFGGEKSPIDLYRTSKRGLEVGEVKFTRKDKTVSDQHILSKLLRFKLQSNDTEGFTEKPNDTVPVKPIKVYEPTNKEQFLENFKNPRRRRRFFGDLIQKFVRGGKASRNFTGYHGSADSFTEIDASKLGLRGGNLYGAGFNVSMTRNMAESYAKDGFVYPTTIKGGISDFIEANSLLSKNPKALQGMEQIFKKQKISTSGLGQITFKNAAEKLTEAILPKIERNLPKKPGANANSRYMEALGIASQKARQLLVAGGIPGIKVTADRSKNEQMAVAYDLDRVELGKPKRLKQRGFAKRSIGGLIQKFAGGSSEPLKFPGRKQYLSAFESLDQASALTGINRIQLQAILGQRSRDPDVEAKLMDVYSQRVKNVTRARKGRQTREASLPTIGMLAFEGKQTGKTRVLKTPEGKKFRLVKGVMDPKLAQSFSDNIISALTPVMQKEVVRFAGMQGLDLSGMKPDRMTKILTMMRPQLIGALGEALVHGVGGTEPALTKKGRAGGLDLPTGISPAVGGMFNLSKEEASKAVAGEIKKGQTISKKRFTAQVGRGLAGRAFGGLIQKLSRGDRVGVFDFDMTTGITEQKETPSLSGFRNPKLAVPDILGAKATGLVQIMREYGASSVLTARSGGPQGEMRSALQMFFKKNGILVPSSRLITLGDQIGDMSTPEKKARSLFEMVKKYGRGKVDFFDDDPRNIEAARDVKGVNARRVKVRRASGGEIPIMAQEGEFVINKNSAQAIGYGNLARLNKYHSGGVVKYASGGGPTPPGPDLVLQAERSVKQSGIIGGTGLDAFLKRLTAGFKGFENAVRPSNGLIRDLEKSIFGSNAEFKNLIAAAKGGKASIGDLTRGMERIKNQFVASGMSTKDLILAENALNQAREVGQIAATRLAAQQTATITQYFQRLGLAIQRLPGVGTAVKGLDKLGSSLAGNAGLVGSIALGTLAGQGEKFFDTKTEKGSVGAAKFEQGLATAGTGLAVASSVAMIPGVGPVLAGLTLLGTAVFAGADALTDFTGTAKKAKDEFERAKLAKTVDDATDALGASFREYEKAVDDAAKQAAADKVMGNIGALSQARSQQSFQSLKLAQTENKGILDRPQIAGFAAREAGKNQEMANISTKMIENQIKTGGWDTLDVVVKENLQNAIIRSNPDVLTEIFSRSQGKSEAQARAIEEEILARERASGKVFNEINKRVQLEKAIEAAANATKRLSDSFEKMANTMTAAFGRFEFELNKASDSLDNTLSAIGGDARVGKTSLSNINVLENKESYSPEDYNKAIAQALSVIPQAQAIRLKGAAQLNKDLESVLGESVKAPKAGEGPEDLQKSAREAGEKLIDSLAIPEDLRKDFKAKLSGGLARITAEVEKEAESKPETDKQQLFKDKLGDLAKEMGIAESQINQTLIGSLKAQEAAINKFGDNLNKASEALVQARARFAKADDITSQAAFDIRRATTGVGVSPEEAAQRRNNRVGRSLTASAGARRAFSGLVATDVQGIRDVIGTPATPGAAGSGLIAEQQRLQKEQERLTKEGGSTQDIENNMRAMRENADAIRDGTAALEELADNTEAYSAALDKLQQITELQSQSVQDSRNVLTAGPEENLKRFRAMQRLNARASGANITNTREAQLAATQTFRQTGSRAQARLARENVLAQQRREELDTFQAFKPAMQLQMMNQGFSSEQIDARMRETEARLLESFARSQGLQNDPKILGDIARLRLGPDADPAAKKAREQAEKAAAVQAEANQKLGELANSQANLIQSQNSLKNSIDQLNATTQMAAGISKLETSTPGTPGSPGSGFWDSISSGFQSVFSGLTSAIGPAINGFVPIPGVGAPAAPFSKGGVIYAAAGTLVNFQPKGTDTVPAMLTPGEFVVNAQAAAQHLPLLKAINSGSDVINSTGLKRGGIVYLQTGGQLKKDETIEQDAAVLDAEVQARQQAYAAGNAESQADQAQQAQTAADTTLPADFVQRAAIAASMNRPGGAGDTGLVHSMENHARMIASVPILFGEQAQAATQTATQSPAAAPAQQAQTPLTAAIDLVQRALNEGRYQEGQFERMAGATQTATQPSAAAPAQQAQTKPEPKVDVGLPGSVPTVNGQPVATPAPVPVATGELSPREQYYQNLVYSARTPQLQLAARQNMQKELGYGLTVDRNGNRIPGQKEVVQTERKARRERFESTQPPSTKKETETTTGFSRTDNANLTAVTRSVAFTQNDRDKAPVGSEERKKLEAKLEEKLARQQELRDRSPYKEAFETRAEELRVAKEQKEKTRNEIFLRGFEKVNERRKAEGLEPLDAIAYAYSQDRDFKTSKRFTDKEAEQFIAVYKAKETKDKEIEKLKADAVALETRNKERQALVEAQNQSDFERGQRQVESAKRLFEYKPVAFGTAGDPLVVSEKVDDNGRTTLAVMRGDSEVFSFASSNQKELDGIRQNLQQQVGVSNQARQEVVDKKNEEEARREQTKVQAQSRAAEKANEERENKFKLAEGASTSEIVVGQEKNAKGEYVNITLAQKINRQVQDEIDAINSGDKGSVKQAEFQKDPVAAENYAEKRRAELTFKARESAYNDLRREFAATVQNPTTSKARIAAEDKITKATSEEEKVKIIEDYNKNTGRFTTLAKAQDDARIAAEQAKEAQTQKEKEAQYWINSSNPLVSGLGYAGGVLEAPGRVVRGGAMAAEGLALQAAGAILPIDEMTGGAAESRRAQRLASGSAAEVQERMRQRQAELGVLEGKTLVADAPGLAPQVRTTDRQTQLARLAEIKQMEREDTAKMATASSEAYQQVVSAGTEAGVKDLASVGNLLFDPTKYQESAVTQFNVDQAQKLRDMGMSGTATALDISNTVGYLASEFSGPGAVKMVSKLTRLNRVIGGVGRGLGVGEAAERIGDFSQLVGSSKLGMAVGSVANKAKGAIGQFGSDISQGVGGAVSLTKGAISRVIGKADSALGVSKTASKIGSTVKTGFKKLDDYITKSEAAYDARQAATAASKAQKAALKTQKAAEKARMARVNSVKSPYKLNQTAIDNLSGPKTGQGIDVSVLTPKVGDIAGKLDKIRARARESSLARQTAATKNRAAGLAKQASLTPEQIRYERLLRRANKNNPGVARNIQNRTQGLAKQATLTPEEIAYRRMQRRAGQRDLDYNQIPQVKAAREARKAEQMAAEIGARKAKIASERAEGIRTKYFINKETIQKRRLQRQFARRGGSGNPVGVLGSPIDDAIVKAQDDAIRMAQTGVDPKTGLLPGAQMAPPPPVPPVPVKGLRPGAQMAPPPPVPPVPVKGLRPGAQMAPPPPVPALLSKTEQALLQLPQSQAASFRQIASLATSPEKQAKLLDDLVSNAKKYNLQWLDDPAKVEAYLSKSGRTTESVTRGGQVRGKFEARQGNTAILLTETASATTGAHETAHFLQGFTGNIGKGINKDYKSLNKAVGGGLDKFLRSKTYDNIVKALDSGYSGNVIKQKPEELFSVLSEAALNPNAQELFAKSPTAQTILKRLYQAKGYEHGGIVYANNGAFIAAKQGTDTVPAMLTPGEFVVNRQATQTHLPVLQAINSGYMDRGGIVNYLANGGIVAPRYYQEGAMVRGVSNTGGTSIGADLISGLTSTVSALQEQFTGLQEGLMSTFETFGQYTSQLSESVGSFGSSTAGLSQSINEMPTTLTAQVDANVTQNVVGMGNMEQQFLGQADVNSKMNSQNTVNQFGYEQNKASEGQLFTA